MISASIIGFQDHPEEITHHGVGGPGIEQLAQAVTDIERAATVLLDQVPDFWLNVLNLYRKQGIRNPDLTLLKHLSEPMRVLWHWLKSIALDEHLSLLRRVRDW